MTAKDKVQREVHTIKVGSWERDNIPCPPANTKSGSECMMDTRAEVDGEFDDGERRRRNKQLYMQEKRRKKCQK